MPETAGLDDPGLGRPPNIIIGAGVLQPLAERDDHGLDGSALSVAFRAFMVSSPR
jgi:hypothetical protein